MWEKLRENKLFTLLMIIVVVYFFLRYLTPLISPILIAMLFVTIFGPTLKKMQEKLHVHRQIGAVFLLIAACLIIGILVWILFSWIVGSLPEWVSKLDTLEQQIGIWVHNGCEIVGNAIGIDSAYLEATITYRIQEGFDSFQLQTGPIISQSLEYVKVIAGIAGFLLTFIISTVLLAKDYDRIMNNLLDREDCHVLLEVICGIIRYIATYVKAQAIIMTSISILAAAVLSFMGIRHGALWGLLAGIMDALPFIGTGIVLMPLAIAQLFYGAYGKALICLLLYCGCALLREIAEPKLIGSQIGVPPIAILLSVYVGLQLFGIGGIIKGPLGFIIIYQTYLSLQKRSELKQNELNRRGLKQK